MTDRTTPAPETGTTFNPTSQSPECIADAASAHGDKCNRDDHAGLADVLKFELPRESIRLSAPQTAEALHQESLRQEITALLSECTPKADQQRQERYEMHEISHKRYIDAVDAAHESHRALNAINSLLIPAFVPPGGYEPDLDMVKRGDLCALLSIVNGHLGRSLEMASDSDGKR